MSFCFSVRARVSSYPEDEPSAQVKAWAVRPLSKNLRCTLRYSALFGPELRALLSDSSKTMPLGSGTGAGRIYQ